MKKVFYFIVFAVTLISFNTKAQCPGCVIDQACTANPAAPALCPSVLPDGFQNVAYDQNITFYMPYQFTVSGFNVTLNQITVNGITGIPQGLDWQTSASPSNIFYPSLSPPASERGCVKICGTPTVFGQFNIIVAVSAEVSTPLGNITQDETFSLPILINSPPGINASFTFNPSFGCADLDVDLEALIEPNGLEVVSYDWDFDNGNTSNLKIPPVQSFAVADTYFVSLTTKKYAYRLSSVAITATGNGWCGDIEEFICGISNPDLFFEFNNNSGPQSSATVDNQVNADFPSLNYILTDSVFSLQFYDEDLISGNDDLGIFQFTVTAPGSFNITTNEISGNFLIDTVFTQQFYDVDTIIVYQTPAVPNVIASGNLSFCQGNSITLSTTNNGNSLQWFLNDSTLLFGEVNPSLTVNSSGNYSVMETNNLGCSQYAANTAVTVYPVPPAPNLIVNGGYINSSSVGNLQWYFNGVAITGENQANLLYGDTGTYTLTITSTDNCVNSATVYIATPNSVYNINTNNHFTLYPNPVKETLFISKNSNLKLPFTIEIMDTKGALIYQQNELIANGNLSIDVSNFDNGVYFISIFNNNFKQQQKIVIIK
jgi:hypothetical protein